MDEEEEHERLKDDVKVSHMKETDIVTFSRRAVLKKKLT